MLTVVALLKIIVDSPKLRSAVETHLDTLPGWERADLLRALRAAYEDRFGEDGYSRHLKSLTAAADAAILSSHPTSAARKLTRKVA